MTTCRLWRAAVALASVLLLTLAAPHGHAQVGDQAAARALFEQGRKLLKAGDHAAACPKFEAADRLYKSAGILLNLGDCLAKLGRTASAWTAFGEAASVASRTNRPEDAQEARRRQTALEAELVRLIVAVPNPVPDLVVERDGAVLAAAAWGTALPVDPGEHEVHVQAPGYEVWSSTVSVSTPGETVTLTVPELVRLPEASKPPSPAPPRTNAAAPAEREARFRPRTLEWGLIVGGAAVGVGGGVLMLVESRRANTARVENDPDAYDAANAPWTIGLVGALVGGACVAGGIVLLTTTGERKPAVALATSPWLGRNEGGVGLGGVW